MQEESKTFMNAYTRPRAIYGEQCMSLMQWLMLSAASKHGLSKRLLLSLKDMDLMPHYKSELLMMETMLRKKN